MQKKRKTLSNFCEFKALVEEESRKQVKALRSDNGGEYISGEFKDFCSKERIRREIITPHNPQQNWVAETKNKTIVGVARAMLERELDLHAEEELSVRKMNLQMWIIHRRNFMEWRSLLMLNQTSDKAESIPQKRRD